MTSLQSKLTAGLLLSLIIIFTSLWLMVSLNATRLAENYIASRITHDIETLLASIRFDTAGQLTIDASRIDQVYNQPFSGHYYLISSNEQQIVSRSLWDQTLAHTSLKNADTQITHQAGPEQQQLLVVSSGFIKQQQAVTLSVAEDLNPIHHNIRQFQFWLALSSATLLLILLLLQIVILRHSLKPLHAARNEIDSLEQGQLDKLSTDVPDELKPFIRQVNQLLALTAQRLRRSREASADLAHAIKKPLTVMQHLLHKQSFETADREMLAAQVNTIYQLADRILKRASLSGPSYRNTAFSFSTDLPALLKTLSAMHSRNNIELSLTIDDTIGCNIDREDMLELLGNLLDNAYKWARHHILLDIHLNHALTVRIEDDGPGAAAEQLQQIRQRGVRLDESIEGHGFGLAIAADIVAEYHGEMVFDSSATLGGFSVVSRYQSAGAEVYLY